MKLELKLNALDAPIQKAFSEGPDSVVETLKTSFTKAITDPIYAWPRGESPRDIVDTGALRDSLTVAVSGTTAEFSWPATSPEGFPYPAAVHNGYRTRAGNFMPARPWTKIALAATPPSAIMQRNLDRMV